MPQSITSMAGIEGLADADWGLVEHACEAALDPEGTWGWLGSIAMQQFDAVSTENG